MINEAVEHLNKESDKKAYCPHTEKGNCIYSLSRPIKTAGTGDTGYFSLSKETLHVNDALEGT
jgi:hypothetical protein